MAISHKILKTFGEKKNLILAENLTIDACCLFIKGKYLTCEKNGSSKMSMS